LPAGTGKETRVGQPVPVLIGTSSSGDGAVCQCRLRHHSVLRR
jgi:hypothetical protein